MLQRAPSVTIVAATPHMDVTAMEAVVTLPTFKRPQQVLETLASLAAQVTARRFAVIVNRFDWETAVGKVKSGAKTSLERRRSGLRFERVLGAKVHNIDLQDRSAALALLAIVFEPSAEPESAAGNVTLTFSGGAAIRLTVECVEAEMKDLGAVWKARRAPSHSGDES